MADEQSTEKTAVKAADHKEQVTKREQSADKTEQREPGRQEEGRHGEGPTAARQSELTAMASYGDLVELNRAGMDATLKAGEAMLKATSSLAEEMAGFACQRLRTDMETARSLMESGTDWNKAVELQSKFAADAMRDYLEETTKITQLSAQMSREVWRSWQGFSVRLAGREAARPS